MKLKNKPIALRGKDGRIDIARNAHGIPEISAESLADCCYGLGWVHANDRQLQTIMSRIILQGRMAEILAGKPELVEVDRYMRRMNFVPDPVTEIKKMKPAITEAVQSYCDGLNRHIEEHGTVFELRMVGYRHELWTIADSLLLAKTMGFFGQNDVQGEMEKFIVQMIQRGIDEKRIRELFPALIEKIDARLLKSVALVPPPIAGAVPWKKYVPPFTASNNWVVGGARTASGKPIVCNDPHLMVNRLPAVWQEIVMRIPDNFAAGVSVPGVPGIVVGRTKHVAWGVTFAYVDMMDFRIEDCRDGMYRRGTSWKSFAVRTETIKVKKGSPVIETVHENENGILEGDPHTAGKYLAMNWAARHECGADLFSSFIDIPEARTVKELMEKFRAIDSACLSWVMADTKGNIGFQMSGRAFNRPKGVSGLLPLPGWEQKYDPKGFLDKRKFPSVYNPRQGYFNTSNNDLNRWGKATIINLCMGEDRAKRIEQLLNEKKKLTVNDMKGILYDKRSHQAERLMRIIRPLLPDSSNGIILREWNCEYQDDSTGATLFESVYRSLLMVVFGDNGVGRDVIAYMLDETQLFNDYFHNFDLILMKTKSAWFGGTERDALFRSAIAEGLEARAIPYGATRKVLMAHLMLGGKLPRFLGLDYGPISLPGSRGTVCQGQIMKRAGMLTTFSPSVRQISDMATDEMHTNLPGGPSDRPFSKWYTSDINNWMNGIFKVLK